MSKQPIPPERLMEMVEVYEKALREIGAKYDDERALGKHYRHKGIADTDQEMGRRYAFGKAHKVAWLALIKFHPDEKF